MKRKIRLKAKQRLDNELLASLIKERLRLSTELGLLHQYEADLDESIAMTMDDAGLSPAQQTRVLGELIAKAWSSILGTEPFVEVKVDGSDNGWSVHRLSP